MPGVVGLNKFTSSKIFFVVCLVKHGSSEIVLEPVFSKTVHPGVGWGWFGRARFGREYFASRQSRHELNGKIGKRAVPEAWLIPRTASRPRLAALRQHGGWKDLRVLRRQSACCEPGTARGPLRFRGANHMLRRLVDSLPDRGGEGGRAKPECFRWTANLGVLSCAHQLGNHTSASPTTSP